MPESKMNLAFKAVSAIPETLEAGTLYVSPSKTILAISESAYFDITGLAKMVKADENNLGGVRTGFTKDGPKYPVKLDESGRAYVEMEGQSASEDVIIDISLIQETTGTVEEEPELVTSLKKYATAANSGASVMPKLFVRETKKVSGGTVSFIYPASFNGNVVEVEGQTIIYPGMLSYTKMNPESGNFNVATTFATIIYAANTFVVTGIKTIAMSESGSASKVLAENGTWVSLPSIRVDSEISDTSSNPVQNKVITAALGDKQGKFCHGGTLQVSSINGNTALSVGSVDAKADYVEVQYTGSSNATFDFNSKFSANWFKDRQDKPQRMMFKNNSSTATVTITTKANGNFAYGFSEIILGSNSSVEFHVYRTIVSVSYGNNSCGRSNDHDAIIKTASVMELSTIYLDSGTLPSDIQNRMKEAAVPLIMYHPTYHLRYAASYLWNGEIFCISLVDSQKENTRIINAVYDSTGKWQSKTMVPLGVVSGGTGSKFLNDKGQYVSIPEEVRGTALFFHDGIGQSTVDKGLAVKRTALKPNGITPIAGKDVLVDIQTGIIALITSTDLTNVYCSYDNGTMLNINA